MGQFYDESFTLLSRLLDLLRGFINRSHQSLAAVGVAALVRLCINAGAKKRGGGSNGGLGRQKGPPGALGCLRH